VLASEITDGYLKVGDQLLTEDSLTSASCFRVVAHGAVVRVYCLGEQPMTRRKALPKALSDS
jgi:hypothetical protein